MATSGPAVHEEQLPCIWALAGVLSYRPCDRNYECETCDLFHALRGRTAAERGERTEASPDAALRSRLSAAENAVENQVGAYLSSLVTGCRLYLDRFYSPNHFWLSVEEGNEVSLGLDGHILRILYPIDEIVAPRVGLCLRRGEPCGWITRRSKAIPIAIPISGELRAVNVRNIDAVKAQGRIEDPEDWLFRVEAHERWEDVDDLYRGEEILIWYLGKIRILKRYLLEAVAPKADLGVTLSDGGVIEQNLEEILGRERFDRLIDEILS